MSEHFDKLRTAAAYAASGTHLLRALFLTQSANAMRPSWWTRVGQRSFYVFDSIADDSLLPVLGASDDPVTVFLDSDGGDVREARAIGEHLANRDSTAVALHCSSAANFIFAGANRRFASPDCVFRVHSITSMIEGSPAQLRAAADKLESETELHCAWFADRTGIDLEQSRSWWTGPDLVMTADEAMSAGLVHEITDAPDLTRPVEDSGCQDELGADLARAVVITARNIEDPASLRPWLNPTRELKTAAEFLTALSSLTLSERGVELVDSIVQPLLTRGEGARRPISTKVSGARPIYESIIG